jgi:hypothetical protein
MSKRDDARFRAARPSGQQRVTRQPRALLPNRSIGVRRPGQGLVFDADRLAGLLHAQRFSGCFGTQAMIDGCSDDPGIARRAGVVGGQRQQRHRI